MCEHYCPSCRDTWTHDDDYCDDSYTKLCPKCELERGDEYD